MCLCVFSNTTIASSTTVPTANTSPKRVRVLIEKPKTLKEAKVPIKETGIALDTSAEIHTQAAGLRALADDIEDGPWKRYDLKGVYRDASLLFDDDGRVYLIYGGGEIWATELTSDVTAIKKDGFNKVIIENATKVVGDIGDGLVAEGSHIQKINGNYYIFNIVCPKGGIRT